MGILRYTDGELRHLLCRAIRIRWPGEDLLFVTQCQVEPPAGTLFTGPGEPPNIRPETGWGHTQAVLAATRSRLIYQERTTNAVLLRSIAVALGILAVIMLFLRSGLVGSAAVAMAGLVLWAVAKLTELFTVGGTSIEFHRIEIADRLAQRIEGTVGSGTVYRLRVIDPSDFGMIASLVGNYGGSAA